jgi:D-glycero-D-manno-heptose 1,7-bisphosphate phosphatase
MIGDSARDILAARRAGCALAVLVKTGKGVTAEKELAASGVRPDHITDNLDSASHWVLSQWF